MLCAVWCLMTIDQCTTCGRRIGLLGRFLKCLLGKHYCRGIRCNQFVTRFEFDVPKPECTFEGLRSVRRVVTDNGCILENVSGYFYHIKSGSFELKCVLAVEFTSLEDGSTLVFKYKEGDANSRAATHMKTVAFQKGAKLQLFM